MLKLATKFAPQHPALDTAYRAGFRFAEVWLDSNILADWQATARLLQQFPFGYAVHFPNQLTLDAEMLQNTVSLYRDIGCRCLVIHQPMFDKFHAELLRLGPELKLAVENHKLNLEGFTRWAERNPGLTLDVEHLWKFTLGDDSLEKLLANVQAFLERFGDKLRHVHLPGYWPGFEEHRPMYCSRDMIFPVLSALMKSGFDGLIVSEVEPVYQNRSELRMDTLLFDTWRDTQKPS